MSMQSLWAPGHVAFPEWPAKEWRRQTFGTTIVLAPDADNWVHAWIAAPPSTPHAVHFLYDARGSSSLQVVEVWTGKYKIGPLRTDLGWRGNHTDQLDAQNGVEIVPDGTPFPGVFAGQGIGISMFFRAGTQPNGSEIYFTAFGYDYWTG